MSYLTQYMDLWIWNEEQNYWNTTELAENWKKISEHNHIPSEGGVQISTDAIQNEAITTSLIAKNAVTKEKITNESISPEKIQKNSINHELIEKEGILGEDIAKGSISAEQLESNVLPLGMVVFLLVETVPTGWHACDGTAWADIPNSLGKTTGYIPNLIEKFIIGAGLTEGPSLEEKGGASTYNLEHNHAVDSHDHSVPSHTHGIGSSENAENGLHTHNFQGNKDVAQSENEGPAWAQFAAEPVSESTEKLRQCLFIPEITISTSGGKVHQAEAPIVPHGEHYHGHWTTTMNPTSFNTGDASPETSYKLEKETKILPPYVALLPIMRVK